MLSTTVWDVQHGSAMHLRTPNGKNIIIDLGVGDISQGNNDLSPLMQLWMSGVRHLDQVIITHPHRDHLDDIFNFDRFYPSALHRINHLSESDIRAGNRSGDSRILDKYFEIDRRYNRPLGPGEDAEQPENNGGVTFRTFSPQNCSTSALNDHSIVTFVTYAGSTICIPGDNEAASWRELLSGSLFRQLLSQTNVFVASHHGREAGYCEDVFTYCKPVLIVVSDGPNSDTTAANKYRQHARGWAVTSRSGHATEERKVLTTRCDGTIHINSYLHGTSNYLNVTIE